MRSIYSTGWDIIKHHFDYKGALDNWARYAGEISIAVNTSTDGTFEALEAYALERGYPVSLIRTSYDFATDPKAYGKIENAALQNCTGDIMIQCNMDERWRADPDVLDALTLKLYASGAKAYFIPTVDLYGSKDRSLPKLSRKWYMHLPGCFRGPVNFGLKADGRPDYNKTSTDELIDRNSNLVPTISLIEDLSLESVRGYVARGFPISYHLGYLNATDRLSRSLWWKDFWFKATGGDENQHPTSVEEIAARETVEHGLPLWDTKDV